MREQPKDYHEEPITKDEYPEFYTCIGDTCPPIWFAVLLVLAIIGVPTLIAWWVI